MYKLIRILLIVFISKQSLTEFATNTLQSSLQLLFDALPITSADWRIVLVDASINIYLVLYKVGEPVLNN